MSCSTYVSQSATSLLSVLYSGQIAIVAGLGLAWENPESVRFQDTYNTVESG